jgi:hypothetical protein
MVTMEWRVATRRRGAAPGWDIGLQPMLKAVAQARAEEYDRKYPGYEHKAIRVPSRLEAPSPRPGGTSGRSPHQGKVLQR